MPEGYLVVRGTATFPNNNLLAFLATQCQYYRVVLGTQRDMHI